MLAVWILKSQSCARAVSFGLRITKHFSFNVNAMAQDIGVRSALAYDNIHFEFTFVFRDLKENCVGVLSLLSV